MTDEIVVAGEDARPDVDLSVQEAVRGHADPDGVAEVLASPEDSAAADERTTLDEFGDGE